MGLIIKLGGGPKREKRKLSIFFSLKKLNITNHLS